MRRRIAQSGLCAGVLLVLALAAVPAHAIQPDEQMRFADGLYVRGLYDLALNEYLRLSREATDFPRLDVVLYRIGECYRRLGNAEAAERFYLRVGREHPNSEYRQRADFRRAETFIVRGRYADALTQFRTFLERESSPELAAPAWYYRGHAALRIKDRDEAERALNVVLDRYADSSFASFAALDLAELYQEQPDRAADVPALYARAASNPATPDVAAEALFQQAEWYARRSDHARSAELFDQLLQAHPGSGRAAAAALQAAWSFYHAGRYAETLTRADQTWKGDMAHTQAAEWLYVVANAQRQLLRADDARVAYTTLLDTFPDHELAKVATYEMALIAFRQDQHEEVVSRVAGLATDEVNRTDVYWLLAESYAQLGRTDEAVQYYRRLLEADPDSEQAARALYRLGRVLQNRKDYIQAARTYRQLADRFPDDPFAADALFAAGFCMAMEERFEDAAKDWERLTSNYGEHERAEEARFQRAVALMHVGRDRQARTAFNAFLKQHPDSAFAATAHYWLAVLAEKEGKDSDAEKALRAALALEPEPGLRDQARYRLALHLQREQQFEESADLLEALVGAPPEGVSMPLALLEWLAVYRLDEQAYEPAEEAARRLLERADRDDWKQMAWALLGRSLMGQGDDTGAVKAFEASRDTPAHTREGAEAALFLGELSLKRGHEDDAAGQFRRAAEVATEDEWGDIRARAYFGLGEAAERAESWDNAARFFLSVGVLFDDATLTPRALERGADALGKAGRDAERAQTLKELNERYPDYKRTTHD